MGGSLRTAMRRFAQIDMFGDGDGDGNPLAVVIDGDGPTTAQM
jgi:predicted PhzF superfamily epimerase YddE/YHI9